VYSGAFLDTIAEAEHNTDGYSEVNPGKAWGRYQMTRDALIDAGIHVSKDKMWTGPLARQMGIKGEQDFLYNPLAQEKAIQVYLERTERALRKKGATAHIGRTFKGIKAKITVTQSGLLAAAHRRGAGNVALYLDHLKRHNWISDRNTFPEGELEEIFLNVETRLRLFQATQLRPP
jgi:hypothetical protein